jgi:GntR family transcriptional repressor for pyruvate dehydrogenase complex
VRRLEVVLEEQARQIAGGETGVEADSAFHSALARAAKNKVFLRLNDAMVQSLRETRERSLQTDGRPARSLAGHRKILKAIRAKDPGKARKAMLEHLEAIERNILRLRGREGKGRGRKSPGRLSRAG